MRAGPTILMLAVLLGLLGGAGWYAYVGTACSRRATARRLLHLADIGDDRRRIGGRRVDDVGLL
jgi:hypothetical protein